MTGTGGCCYGIGRRSCYGSRYGHPFAVAATHVFCKLLVLGTTASEGHPNTMYFDVLPRGKER